MFPDVIEEPPAFEFTYTRSFIRELLQRRRQAGGAASVRQVLRIVLLFVFGGLLFASFYFFRRDLNSPGRIGEVSYLVFLFLFFLAYPRWQGWLMYRMTRRSPGGQGTIRVEFTPQGITTVTAVASAQLTWAAFIRARQLADGFLLYQGPRLVYWLPVRCMVAGQPAEVELFLRANVADFRRV